VASSNALYDDWKNLSDDEYELKKKEMIEETLNELERILPNARSYFDFIDAATPLTVERYTHHYRGASFGTKFEGLDVSMKLHEEVEGLYHSGSVGIIMSGWLGAANYGVIQANNIDSYLHKQQVRESL
jgi:phytoene dehydrogenase-like protein